MCKDPAFLFYSKDFYEGTRTMLPIERACYIDLIIYQHQHDFIPDNIERLQMYCSGVPIDVIATVLNAKFKLTDNGWTNIVLQDVIEKRGAYTEKQAINGKVGNFYKKAKLFLSGNDYDELRELLKYESKEYIADLYDNNEINKENLIAMRDGLRDGSNTHLAIANAIVNNNTVLSNISETISEETDTLSLDCQLFKDQKLPIGERKTNFKHIVEKLISTKYSKELCEGFFNFWTQIDTKKPNSMKFETQSTWNTSLRLATWKRNDEKGVYKKPMAQQQSEQPQENELFEIYRGVRISKKLTPEARQKEIDRIDMVKKLAI